MNVLGTHWYRRSLEFLLLFLCVFNCCDSKRKDYGYRIYASENIMEGWLLGCKFILTFGVEILQNVCFLGVAQ